MIAHRDGKFDLEERLLDYSASVIRLVEKLPPTRASSHVAGQLMRAGTAALPNHGEAQGAESRDDFIHKMSLGLKELREAFRWLRLLKRVPMIQPTTRVDPVLAETEELIKIFSASIRTARAGKERQPRIHRRDPAP